MSVTSNKYSISNSLDWSAVEARFLRHAFKLSYKRELVKMIRGIRESVAELSRAEVLARRGKRLEAEKLLTKINEDIEMAEEFLIIAALVG